MPRNVRNWWLRGHMEGVATPINTGPRGRDDGFELTVYQRDDGNVSTACRLVGHAHPDGTLTLSIHHQGATSALTTER